MAFTFFIVGYKNLVDNIHCDTKFYLSKEELLNKSEFNSQYTDLAHDDEKFC